MTSREDGLAGAEGRTEAVQAVRPPHRVSLSQLVLIVTRHRLNQTIIESFIQTKEIHSVKYGLVSAQCIGILLDMLIM